MSQKANDFYLYILTAAQEAVRRYVQDILDAEALTQQLIQEWQQRGGEEPPSPSILSRLAQRLCSRALFEAWRSTDAELYDHACENLRRYLGKLLLHTRYAHVLQKIAGAVEDVLQQALETLQTIRARNPQAGPDDPAAFIKWTQTILFRQAHQYLEQQQHNMFISLDAQPELFIELIVDRENQDPLEQVLAKEVRETLGQAILSLRNQRYRNILIYTYLAGLSDYELAEHLQVKVQAIYLWRYRALKALRSKPEIIELLRSLLE